MHLQTNCLLHGKIPSQVQHDTCMVLGNGHSLLIYWVIFTYRHLILSKNLYSSDNKNTLTPSLNQAHMIA